MTQAWRSRSEAGKESGIVFLLWVAKTLGRPILQLCLIPVALYQMLVRAPERKASSEFLRRISGKNPGLWGVFRHFYTFSCTVADRVFFLTDQQHQLRIRLHNAQPLSALVKQGRGGIVLSAHIGSFDAARVLGAEAVLRIVQDIDVNQRLTRQLASLNDELSKVIIDVNQPPVTLALAIKEALGRGEWVGFMADRHRPGGRTTSCDFLGSKAEFPLGSFVVAALFKVPLICIFPLYINGRYEVYCEIMSERYEVPRNKRDEQFAASAQQFADRLAYHARMAPYSWSNFYDFWNQDR